MSIKPVVDLHKPWFDYSGCLLGTAAWFVAVLYVGANNLRPKPASDWGVTFLIWVSVALAFAYGIFLISRLYVMTRGIVGEIEPRFQQKGVLNALARAALVFWFFLGLPVFVLGLCFELLEQFTDKIR
jgi:hypothetical protein